MYVYGVTMVVWVISFCLVVVCFALHVQPDHAAEKFRMHGCSLGSSRSFTLAEVWA